MHSMRMILITAMAGLSFFSLSIAPSDASTIYFNDFNTGFADTNWTSSLGTVPTDVVPKPNGHYDGSFLGQFSGNHSATLSLSGLSKGMINLSFDTYFIRSWDGSAGADLFGPDYFTVSVVDGVTLLNATFSNGNPEGQSYVGNGIPSPEYEGTSNTSMTGSLQRYSLGYYFYDGFNDQPQEYAMDSVYHFDFSFFNASDSLQLLFAGSGLQDALVTTPDDKRDPLNIYGTYTYLDESWGIDNVRVAVTPVPEPATLWLLSAGGLGLLVLRRKRQ